MKRIGALVCRNGLGHIKRTLVVANAMAHEDDVFWEVVCREDQVNRLEEWPVLSSIRKTGRIRFHFLDTYVRWSEDLEYYRGDRLLRWHRILKRMNLESYDLLISDNLVEALTYRPDAVLMGSFLWHDVFYSCLPENPLVKEYRQMCAHLMRTHRPPMIVNRYFAMPATREQAVPVEVGMLPFREPVEKKDDAVTGVLFLCGSSKQVLDSFAAFLRSLAQPNHYRVFLDRELAGLLDAPAFAFDDESFSMVDAVVARPGMGIITDCIGTATPLFCFSEANPEMEHNAAVLESMGLGRRIGSLKECFDQIRCFYSDSQTMARYREIVGCVDNNGLSQTLEFLRRRLN